MKTHECGIGFFASALINRTENAKTRRAARRENKAEEETTKAGNGSLHMTLALGKNYKCEVVWELTRLKERQISVWLLI